ncbi:substrate-binding periplasmic protein [Aliagarivorans taiwanensis]|uniref:substrate-binding periplasmic protein n=1 Tax=Aliagarivorans taiwanensis TaxID=561966 RepID=UPI00047D6534|nr:transporter substrate-binding domain-containing protein [Aliagarivorans taiwanensis]
MLSFCVFASVATAEPTGLPVVRIATGEHEPFTSQLRDDGGLINAIVAAAFLRAGYQAKFDYLPWQRALATTQAGVYHASSYWAYKEQRKLYFLHSEPLVYGGSVLISLKGEPQYTDLDELSGKVVGAVRGYTYNEAFWLRGEQGEYKIELVNTDLQNFKKLLVGRIDALLIDYSVAQTLIYSQLSAEERAMLQVPRHFVMTASVHLLIGKQIESAQTLLQAFNHGLAIIKSNGEYLAITARYPDVPIAVVE